MSIKSVINEKPVITIAIVAAVAAVAVWMGVRSALPPAATDAVYFTADDGKTWFADKDSTVTPYTKDGKEVVRAYLYQCKDGKPFVAYLTKQNPNAVRRTYDTPKTGQSSGSGGGAGAELMTMEFKRPGEGSWELFWKMSNANKAKILNVGCPDGSTPEPVSP